MGNQNLERFFYEVKPFSTRVLTGNITKIKRRKEGTLPFREGRVPRSPVGWRLWERHYGNNRRKSPLLVMSFCGTNIGVTTT